MPPFHRLIPPPPRSGARFTLGAPTTPDPVQVDGEDATALLAKGELEVLGRIPWASNATLLVSAKHEDRCGLAVYKPERGERPLWDFPAGLYRREIAAYLVSEALGWDLVPPTVARDGRFGPGSVQLFVEYRAETTAFELLEADHPAMRRVAAFDTVINNADRKGGHTLLAPDDHVWAIDHGVCFHTEPKLRTVIWEFAGDPVPGEILADLDRFRGELRGEDPGREELVTALGALLTPTEYDALVRRTGDLLDAGVFPGPGDSHHPYPWPPV